MRRRAPAPAGAESIKSAKAELLDRLLRFVAAGGVVAYAPSLAACVIARFWLLAAVDSAAYAAGVALGLLAVEQPLLPLLTIAGSMALICTLLAYVIVRLLAVLETAIVGRGELAELLLRELEHRVRNNIQVMASLARLEAERGVGSDGGEGLASVLRKIQAVSIVNDLFLADPESPSIDLGDIAHSLAANARDEEPAPAGAVILSVLSSGNRAEEGRGGAAAAGQRETGRLPARDPGHALRSRGEPLSRDGEPRPPGGRVLAHPRGFERPVARGSGPDRGCRAPARCGEDSRP